MDAKHRKMLSFVAEVICASLAIAAASIGMRVIVRHETIQEIRDSYDVFLVLGTIIVAVLIVGLGRLLQRKRWKKYPKFV